jgi:DtxR family manganese transport transcriptional regulator
MSSRPHTPAASPALPDAAETHARAPEDQADTFQITREAHRSETTEDYVELIADLIDQTGEARPVEIAERMGVTQPTVTKILARLQREGLVIRQPYRSIFLSETGQALAEACRRRHRIVVAFLIALGIDEPTAERDAEGIEHHVSERTLDAFAHFIEARAPAD